jgi:hypothetical protein
MRSPEGASLLEFTIFEQICMLDGGLHLVCMSQDRQVEAMLAYGSGARIIDQSQAVVVCAASFAWSRKSLRGRLARPSVGDSIGMAPSD